MVCVDDMVDTQVYPYARTPHAQVTERKENSLKG